MKDDELRRRLSAFVAPPATEAAKERARHRALIAFRQTPADAVPERGRGWPLAAAGALALLALLVWPRDSRLDRPRADAAVLAEIEALFPGELDAVIDHQGDVQIALSRTPQRTSDQRVLVEFRRGRATIRVLTYSGRRVCVELAGRRACFEALLSARGEVIVAGEDFVSTAQERGSMAGWKITAIGLQSAS